MIESKHIVDIIYLDVKKDIMRGKTLMPTYIEVSYTDEPRLVLRDLEKAFNAFTKQLELFPSIEIYVIRIRDKEHDTKYEYYYIVNKVTKKSYLVNNKGIFYDLLIRKHYTEDVNVFTFLLDSWLEEHFEKINL